MIKFKLFGFGDNEKTTPPLSPAAAVQEVPTSATGTQTELNGKKVVIVDDDPIFLITTAAKLRSAGFHVRTAKEGSEAIAALGEESADAILMDINFAPDVCNGGMGSWDGFQIMTWLRGNPAARGTRFIMVSNSDSPSDRQRAKQLGAVAYFHKPLDYDQLYAAVDTGTQGTCSG